MSQAKRFWLSLVLVFGALRLADVANAVSGLWVVPAHLSPEALGAVPPLSAFGAFLALPMGAIAVVFSRQLCAYATAGDGLRARGLLRDALAAATLLFLAALGAAALALPWLRDTLRVERSWDVFLAVAYGLLSALVPLFTAALQALRRFGAIAASNLLSAPSRLVFLLFCLPALGLSGYFLGQIVAFLVLIAVACWAMRSLLFGPGRCPVLAWRDDARPIARYAGKVALSTLVGFIPVLAVSFVIRARLPGTESGAFYLVSRFSEIAAYCGNTVALVLFPFAVAARTRGESSARLHDGAFLATLLGGAALAALFWFLLPLLFPLIPGYAAYVPHARLAAYLTLVTACNVAVATHFSHAQARDDFRYLAYFIPLSLLSAAALWLFASGSLLRVLHILFACALAQLLCVGAERLLTHERIAP